MSLCSYKAGPAASKEKDNPHAENSQDELSDCDSEASTRTCTVSHEYTPGRPIIPAVRDCVIGASMLNRAGSDASSEQSDDELEEELQPSRLDLNRTFEDSNANDKEKSVVDGSATHSATKRKMPPLFPSPEESTAREPDIIDVLKKLEQLTLKVDSLQKEVNELRAENAAVKQDHEKLRAFVDTMLEVVPSDPEFFEKPDSSNEFIVTWENKLRAQCDIQGYKIGLENGVFPVKAPQRRAVLIQPYDGQSITIQAIQSKGATAGPKVNRPSTFVFKSPDGKENVAQ